MYWIDEKSTIDETEQKSKKGLVIDSMGGKIWEGKKRLLIEYVCL